MSVLAGVHALLVVEDSAERETLVQMLRDLGAHVSHTDSQASAIGMYFRMFKEQKIPRLIISDWWLCPQSSPQYRFLSRYAKSEIESACTCAELIKNVFELDKDTFYVIYSKDTTAARLFVEKNKVPVQIFDKRITPVTTMLTGLATHSRLISQRLPTEVIHKRLERIASNIQAGILDRMSTPIPS